MEPREFPGNLIEQDIARSAKERRLMVTKVQDEWNRYVINVLDAQFVGGDLTIRKEARKAFIAGAAVTFRIICDEIVKLPTCDIQKAQHDLADELRSLALKEM
jgi:hypothetical protein